MNDLISRQAAIDALSDGALVNYQAAGHNNGLVKAIDVINGLPSAQPEKSTEKRTETHACDLISRQAAIDALCEDYCSGHHDCKCYPKCENLRAIQDLPSAQPDIIRCKDCRWWDKSEDSPFGYCMAMKHGYVSEHWEIGIYRRYKGDFYCADAERRTDEQTD